MDTRMKKDRAIYWATTGMVLFVMVYSILRSSIGRYPEGRLRPFATAELLQN